jgi:hypothetical protein
VSLDAESGALVDFTLEIRKQAFPRAVPRPNQLLRQEYEGRSEGDP